MPKDTIRVRVTNNPKFPVGTKVELLLPRGEAIDMTAEASVYWPIKIEIDGNGTFAILKLPVESISVGDE